MWQDNNFWVVMASLYVIGLVLGFMPFIAWVSSLNKKNLKNYEQKIEKIKKELGKTQTTKKEFVKHREE